MKKIIFLLVILPSLFLKAQADLNPGTERWNIKTTLPESYNEKFVPLYDLLNFGNPIKKYSKVLYDKKRISYTVENGLKEGDIVTTRGYIHLIALERSGTKHTDGDYHIQIRPTAEWSDSCLVVEVALPQARFVKDKKVRNLCRKVREFIDEEILNGDPAPVKAKQIENPPYVEITGQLFFDGTHLMKNGNTTPRGKTPTGMHKKMRSYTCWEIHPITAIKFVDSK